MTRLLALEGVTRHFGGLTAVDEVSFTLDEGEIVGLIGPNGAGKTTLFNLISGVFPPHAGRVVFAGQDLAGRPAYEVTRLGLARTHQIVKPLNEMTVLENCMVGACFGRANLSPRAARVAAGEAIDLIGLDDRRDLLAAHLTIAGKKRLEVARALAAKPRLLLLDEVLAGLNPSEVARMIEVVGEIRRQGVAILMIEHLMQAIMSLSDRVVVLNFGRKLAEGSPHTVANDPAVITAYLGDPDIARKLGEEA